MTKTITPAEVLYAFYTQNKKLRKWAAVRTRAPNKAPFCSLTFPNKT